MVFRPRIAILFRKENEENARRLSKYLNRRGYRPNIIDKEDKREIRKYLSKKGASGLVIDKYETFSDLFHLVQGRKFYKTEFTFYSLSFTDIDKDDMRDIDEELEENIIPNKKIKGQI